MRSSRVFEVPAANSRVGWEGKAFAGWRDWKAFPYLVVKDCGDVLLAGWRVKLRT